MYNIYQNIKNKSIATSNNFAILKLAVPDDDLYRLYENRINKHNEMIMTNVFADSGFDLLVPNDIVFDRAFDTKFIDMKVHAEMIYCKVNADKITKVKQDIDKTIDIVHKTIESVLNRGTTIDKLVEKSEDLSISSKLFYKTAANSNKCCLIM